MNMKPFYKIQFRNLIKTGIFVFLMFTCINSFSQNLLPNGGFETYVDCPQMLRTTDKNTELLPGWTWPTVDGTSDYFNSCSSSGMAGVPKNNMGHCPAKEGKGYVGFILKTHAQGKSNYREYIQAKLSKTLEKDKIYCVSMFYRLADCSTFSIDRLGIYFSNHEINIATNRTLELTPQIENPVDYYMNNNNEWKSMYTIYTAKGNEQFVIIGNFYTDDNTGEKHRKAASGCDSRKDYAYYYIDSVQVIELNNKCEPCNCIAQDLAMTVKKDTCFNGGTDLTAKLTGGTPPYRKYQWENGPASRFYKYALSGTHTATAYDDWGCKATAAISFDCGLPLAAKVLKQGYEGGNTGFIEIQAYEGRPPYKYKWSTGATSQNIKNLPFGSYIYTVTDAQGASYTGSVVFIQPLTVIPDAHYTKGNNGYINLKVEGGIKPYKFEWSTGDTTRNIANLPAGTYTYKVTDAEGRIKTETIKFTDPLKVDEDYGFTSGNDGYIRLKVSGGKKPYSFEWSTGQTTADLDSLPAGIYAYIVKDTENRMATNSIRFVEPITVSVESGFIFESDGFINLRVAGGCPPYSFKWSNNETKQNLNYLENGLYQYTVTGSCGKTATDTVRIEGKIILRNVLFETGSTNLLEESYPELNRIHSYMSRKTGVRVEISGHTDNVGAAKYNKDLSKQRAKSVVDYLVEKGIDESRLVYVGYGEEKPITPNDTKEGKARNRRVEFIIIR